MDDPEAALVYLVTWCIVLKKEDIVFFSETLILEKIQNVLRRFQGKIPQLGANLKQNHHCSSRDLPTP